MVFGYVYLPWRLSGSLYTVISATYLVVENITKRSESVCLSHVKTGEPLKRFTLNFVLTSLPVFIKIERQKILKTEVVEKNATHIYDQEPRWSSG